MKPYMSKRRLELSMIAAVAVVAALAWLDARQDSEGALDDFAEQQATHLSTVVKLAQENPRWQTEPAVALRDVGLVVDRIQSSKLIIRGEGGFTDGMGRPIAELEQALGAPRAVVQRDRAELLGLPARMAVGVVRTVDTPKGELKVALIASAARLRDREKRTTWRLLLSVLAGAGIVLGFGLAALRRQRLELELAHEEQLAKADKLATAGALATGIAHEVSTPLSIIVARAEQLKGSAGDNPRAQKAVDVVLEQASRIGAIIRGLLGLIRGEPAGFQTVEPLELAQEAKALVEHRFERAQVSLELKVEPVLPVLRCDRLLLSQALVNVLLNACEACSSGGHVTLTAEKSDALLALFVDDDGQGIKEEVASRATEPLFTTKAGAGTGLGLKIASEIIKHHRGQLSLAPRAGAKGTRVTITLPFALEKIDAAA